MAKKKNMRKNYFIKRSFQTKFILKFCGLVVLGSMIFSALLFFYLMYRGTVTTAFVDSRLSIISTSNYVLPILLGSSFVTIVLIGIATTITVMYISHRIAGPLFRIEKSLEDISKGDLTQKIKLRSTDEINRTAERINKTTRTFKSQMTKIKKMSKETNAIYEKLVSSLNEHDVLSEKIVSDIQDVFDKKQELDREIEFFKTK